MGSRRNLTSIEFVSIVRGTVFDLDGNDSVVTHLSDLLSVGLLFLAIVAEVFVIDKHTLLVVVLVELVVVHDSALLVSGLLRHTHWHLLAVFRVELRSGGAASARAAGTAGARSTRRRSTYLLLCWPSFFLVFSLAQEDFLRSSSQFNWLDIARHLVEGGAAFLLDGCADEVSDAEERNTTGRLFTGVELVRRMGGSQTIREIFHVRTHEARLFLVLGCLVEWN